MTEQDEDVTDPKEAAELIARHATRIVKLASIAGLHVGIKIGPARKPKVKP